jgi:SAM-dependent methyltransferase
MNSEQDTGGMEAHRHDESVLPLPRQRYPEGFEAAYGLLTAYAFTRRYVDGKDVADVVLGRQKAAGVAQTGSLLLARSARSVEVLLSNDAPEIMDPDTAPGTHPAAPNVVYRGVELPELPYPEGRFDVVIAFGVLRELEHPEEFLGEAKRVLNKEGGVLLLFAPDEQAAVSHGRGGGVGGWREIYASELRELLERHFGVVRLYRQGAVAGGFIFPDTEEGASSEEGATSYEAPLSVEVARFSLAESALGRLEAQPPTTRSVIAVCCDAAGTLGQDEQPYVLLDREREVFEECKNLAENLELMLGEVRRMEETEVQAFRETMRTQRRNFGREEALHLRNVVRANILHLRNVVRGNILHCRNVIRGNVHALRKKGVKGSLRGALRRLSALHRRLAAKKPE